MILSLLKRSLLKAHIFSAVLGVVFLNAGCGMYEGTYEQLANDLVGTWEGEHENSRWCASYLSDGSMKLVQIQFYNPGDPSDNSFHSRVQKGVYEVVKGKRLVHRLNLIPSESEQEAGQQIVEASIDKGKARKVEQNASESVGEVASAEVPNYSISQMHVLKSVDQQEMVYYSMGGEEKFTASRKQQCSDIFNF